MGKYVVTAKPMIERLYAAAVAAARNERTSDVIAGDEGDDELPPTPAAESVRGEDALMEVRGPSPRPRRPPLLVP